MPNLHISRMCPAVVPHSQPSSGRKLLVATGNGVQDLDFLKSESEKRLEVNQTANLTMRMPEFTPLIYTLTHIHSP
jgi:hypothetical protein